MGNFLFLLVYIFSCGLTIYSIIGDSFFSQSYLGITLSQYLLALPCVLLSLFAAKYKADWNSRSKMTYASNEIYFLGYIGTIASILAMVFVFSFLKKSFESNMDVVVQSLSIALSTTLVGLVFMFVFKSRCAILDKDDDISVRIEAEVNNKIKLESEQIKKSLGGLAKIIDDTAVSFGELEKKHQTLYQAVKQTDKIADGFRKILGLFENVDSFKLSTETIEGLKTGLNSIVEANNKFNSLNGKIDSVDSSMDNFNTKLQNLSKEAYESNGRITQVGTSVSELSEILDDFAKLERKKLLESRSDQMQLHIDRLISAINALITSIKPLQQGYNNSTHNIARPIGLKIEENEHPVKKMNESKNQESKSKIV